MSANFRRNVVRSLFLSLWAMLTLILFAMVVLLVREIAGNGGNPLASLVTSETPEDTAERSLPDRTSPTGTRAVELFFASADGLQLAPEVRQLQVTGSTVENCRTALLELIKGPLSGGAPVLPPTTNVKALYLLPEGELVVNFSRELQAEYARLSSAQLESLMVEGVAHTVTQTLLQNSQDPKVRKVRILVEDAMPTDAFPAHIDLSEPVAPDAQWLPGRN